MSIENWERLENNKEQIISGEMVVSSWHVMDVESRMEDLKIELTEDQKKEVLQNVIHNHDCNYGITWDHIDWAIESIGKSRRSHDQMR